MGASLSGASFGGAKLDGAYLSGVNLSGVTFNNVTCQNANFNNVDSSFSNKTPYNGNEDIVQLTETCRHSDGSTSINKMIVAKTPDGWKVVTVPE